MTEQLLKRLAMNMAVRNAQLEVDKAILEEELAKQSQSKSESVEIEHAE